VGTNKKILIISYSSLKSDPRVLRQIRILGQRFEIITCGLEPSNLPFVKHFVPFTINGLQMFDISNFFRRWFLIVFYLFPVRLINKFRLFHRLRVYKLYYWNLGNLKLERKLLRYNVDLIIANDLNTLPLALRVSRKLKAKVLFDAHEYSPLELENDSTWMKWESPYLTWLSKKYIPLADKCITVGYQIAKEYEKLTKKNFDVVLNAPKFQQLTPSPVNEVLQFIHHGGAMKARDLHVLVECFLQLPENYILNLLLTKSDPEYYAYLQKLASNSKNIKFHDPVPTEDIAAFINKFDVGLAYIPPVNFNYMYCLPNKFFEFIQARLMIITGPSPEMEKITNDYKLGLVTDGFKADNLRNAILSLTPEIKIKYKQAVDNAAFNLSANKSMKTFDNLIFELCVE